MDDLKSLRTPTSVLGTMQKNGRGRRSRFPVSCAAPRGLWTIFEEFPDVAQTVLGVVVQNEGAQRSDGRTQDPLIALHDVLERALQEVGSGPKLQWPYFVKDSGFDETRRLVTIANVMRCATTFGAACRR
jgi:hypothetical protein